MKTLLFSLFAALSLCLTPAVTAAEDHEADFSAMLANSQLKGSWLPILQGGLGEEKSDSYRIVSAQKKEGNQWIITALMKIQGQEMPVPIPVIVEWAGDTAVLILDEMPAGPEKTYSARVMFHNDVYAGSWWGTNEKGGTISGVVIRD